MLRRTGVTTGQALEWQKKIYEGNKQLSDGSDSSRLLGSLFRLSQAISTQQGPTAALPYRKELVERASEFFGPTHQNTLVAKSNLADTLYKVGEYQESRDRLLPLQRTYQSKGTHLNHLSIVESKLARVQLVLGNEKDALEIIRAVQQRISESEEIDQLGATGTIAMELLSLAQMENGLIDEALKSVTHEVELFEAAGKPEDPDVRPRLQLAYMLNGDFDSALKQREHFHSLSEVSHNTIFQSANTAECLFVKGKHEEATELVKKILALPPNVSPAARVATSKCLQSHMRGLMARIIAEDDPKESERLLLQAVTELSDNSPQLLSNTLRVRALKQHEKNLIELYSSTGRETEAEQWKKRLDL
jgi:tetratricopeptide (TPR) repeat protein